MIRILLCLLLLGSAAHAQTAQPVTPGYMSTTCSGSVVPCFVPYGVGVPTTVTPLAVAPITASTAASSNQVLKPSAGTFLGAQINTTTAAEYVMLFNATALPANGAVTPVAVWQVSAGQTLSISEIPGLSLSTGITLGCSTTGPFTLTASALCMFGSGVVQ